MRYSEPIAALRRIPVYLVDGSGTGVAGAAPSGSEIRVSLSGAAWTSVGGSWIEIGAGAYVYEATQAETETDSFVMLRVAVAGARVYAYAVDIGERIPEDATATARRVPVYLVDGAGDGVTGLTPAGADVEVSRAGGPWAEANGAVVEIGLGAYYYELVEADLIIGTGLVRVADPGAEIYVYTWDVLAVAGELAEEAEPVLADPSAGIDIAPIDHVAAGLARLPHMYRGSDDA